MRRALSRVLAEGIRPLSARELDDVAGGQVPVEGPPGVWSCPGHRVTGTYGEMDAYIGDGEGGNPPAGLDCTA